MRQIGPFHAARYRERFGVVTVDLYEYVPDPAGRGDLRKAVSDIPLTALEKLVAEVRLGLGLSPVQPDPDVDNIMEAG